MFDIPVVQIQQRSSQLEYDILDGAGEPVGQAVQVAGPRPRKGLMSMFGSGLDGARVVVQVTALGGGPSCYVDYKESCPVAIVGGTGAVLGRYDNDWAGMAKEGASGGVLSPLKIPMCHRLIDPADRTVCRLTWEQKRGDGHWIPVGARYTGMDEAQIAELSYKEAIPPRHKDRYRLEFAGPLPEPLRTMVIASPLAFDLSRS